MPIDPQSPDGRTFARLLKELGRRRPAYDLLEKHLYNQVEVPITATRAVREAYQRLRQVSRTNFAELIVEAVRERMMVVGFRTGAAGDEHGDAEAWRIWQANALDADSAIVHRDMLGLSDSYVIVGGVDPEIDAPLITIEDPREVITLHDPRRRRKVLAALKVMRDEDAALDVAYFFTPGYVTRLTRPASLVGVRAVAQYGPEGWELDGDPQRLPAPIVPVVRFANRPNRHGVSIGEFETHLSVLDRINYQVLQRVEVITMQAFRQRAVKGLPTHDDSGNEIDYDDVFSADPGALWELPSTAELWESGVVDIGPIHTAHRDDVQDLAAGTRTPLFYLTPDAANGSAEGASLAREGLVFKVEDRDAQTGESWEQVLSHAFTFAGDTDRAARAGMETIWASPERLSMAERYDAASKAIGAGVPWRTRMERILGFSPQEADRMEVERAQEQLLAAALTPAVDGAQAG